ncbi:hypothetical protein TRFO_39007 [Tritrichomonas foetus]|uniref:Leucine Rich Repeat family protein n=1 Tax=Tritrichomonas foetus TaxID=1144522 RepID=A0A1J4J6G1_9EUKA|nr:hypothetical protein TRFO_39007 [Tritrichomonas foetus]|eukprot:OHS94818.1 hypothetical protein TRFO_39007 [Tritrichomonas foetus]
MATSPERKPIGKIIDGRLDLTDREFGDQDLKKLGVLPTLRTLILTNTQVTNFAFLKPQPNLESIVAINCPVLYLNGLSDQKSLKSLDLTNTPVSKKHDFRSLTAATVGKSLAMLNNQKLTKEEIQIADIKARRQKDKLFLKENDKQKSNEQNPEATTEIDRQTYDAMATVYIKEHQKLFSTFAENEALLFDLQTNGALPVVDETSTEGDIEKAISEIRQRNDVLRDAIREKCQELNIECILDA